MMDRAEAIKRLEPYVDNPCYTNDHREACRMAIAALREQETVTNRNGLTNADRIRAMTDEELAGFLDKCEARGYLDSSIARDASDHCIDMLDWLQQPAGGADHE